MKKDYLAPQMSVVPINGLEQSFCATTGALSPLTESDEMESLNWDWRFVKNCRKLLVNGIQRSWKN